MKRKYSAVLDGIEMTPRIANLRVDERGFPIPWFVSWLDHHGNHVHPGEGKPDFRIIGRGKLADAVNRKLCWICGAPLGRHLCFVVGPMCTVNRVSAEPPCHRDCAGFAVRACPFLAKPRMRRNEEGLPPNHTPAAGGHMVLANPGVQAIWTTHGFEVVRASQGHDGAFIRMDQPRSVEWFTQGRPATREEVAAGFELGLPKLRELAARDGAVRETEEDIVAARGYWPPETQS